MGVRSGRAKTALVTSSVARRLKGVSSSPCGTTSKESSLWSCSLSSSLLNLPNTRSCARRLVSQASLSLSNDCKRPLINTRVRCPATLQEALFVYDEALG